MEWCVHWGQKEKEESGTKILKTRKKERWALSFCHYLWVARNFIDEFFIEIGRIGVEDANPVQAFDLGQGAEEVRQIFTIATVLAPLVGVLSD